MKIDADPNGIFLQLRADKWSTGDEYAAVAEIVPRGKGRAGQEKLSMPIGVNATPMRVDLQPGDYTVRIYLPSGDVLAQSVSIGPDTKPDKGNVDFDLASSPYEWLSLNSAVGAVQRLPNAERVRSLETWRSSASEAEPNFASNLSERVSQAISDFNVGYASLQKVAGVPTGECRYATIDPARPIPEERLRSGKLLEWWMGVADGPPMPLAVTHHDDRNAKLSVPAIAGGPDLLAGARRVFAQVRDPQGGLHHAVYPAGWVRVSRSHAGSPAGAELLMTVVIDSVMRGADEGEEPARWRCAPTVFDVETMTYLGFLYSGQASAAEVMIEHAAELLFEKRINPVAAAAGAFGLLAFSPASGARRTAWRDWIRNLYSMYPALPDGAIAMAQLCLRYGDGESSADDLDIEKLRGYALEAMRRGLPYLTYGIRMLSEILLLLASDDQQHERSGPLVEETARARRLVRDLERRVEPNAFFTVLEIEESTA